MDPLLGSSLNFISTRSTFQSPSMLTTGVNLGAPVQGLHKLLPSPLGHADHAVPFVCHQLRPTWQAIKNKVLEHAART